MPGKAGGDTSTAAAGGVSFRCTSEKVRCKLKPRDDDDDVEVESSNEEPVVVRVRSTLAASGDATSVILIDVGIDTATGCESGVATVDLTSRCGTASNDSCSAGMALGGSLVPMAVS